MEQGNRIPAIFFRTDSTSMHVRQGTQSNSNDGCDDCGELTLNEWSKVVILQYVDLTVSVNDEVCCTNNNYSDLDPARDNVKVYASDSYYAASSVLIKDFDYQEFTCNSLTFEPSTDVIIE